MQPNPFYRQHPLTPLIRAFAWALVALALTSAALTLTHWLTLTQEAA